MGLTETDVDHITQTWGGKKGGKDREIDECSWKEVGGTSIKAFWLRLAVGKVVQGPLLCLMRYNEVCVWWTSTALIVTVGSVSSSIF